MYAECKILEARLPELGRGYGIQKPTRIETTKTKNNCLACDPQESCFFQDLLHICRRNRNNALSRFDINEQRESATTQCFNNQFFRLWMSRKFGRCWQTKQFQSLENLIRSCVSCQSQISFCSS